MHEHAPFCGERMAAVDHCSFALAVQSCRCYLCRWLACAAHAMLILYLSTGRLPFVRVADATAQQRLAIDGSSSRMSPAGRGWQNAEDTIYLFSGTKACRGWWKYWL